jgi:hypothetical protein
MVCFQSHESLANKLPTKHYASNQYTAVNSKVRAAALSLPISITCRLWHSSTTTWTAPFAFVGAQTLVCLNKLLASTKNDNKRRIIRSQRAMVLLKSIHHDQLRNTNHFFLLHLVVLGHVAAGCRGFGAVARRGCRIAVGPAGFGAAAAALGDGDSNIKLV